MEKVIKFLRIINSAFLIFLTLITIIDVIARYIFHTSILDAITLSSYLLCMINILALSDVTYSEKHVFVEIIYNRFNPKIRKFFDMFCYLIGSFLFFLMGISSYFKFLYAFKKGIYKGWMELPESPVKFVFTIGCFLTAITFFTLLVKKYREKV